MTLEAPTCLNTVPMILQLNVLTKADNLRIPMHLQPGELSPNVSPLHPLFPDQGIHHGLVYLASGLSLCGIFDIRMLRMSLVIAMFPSINQSKSVRFSWRFLKALVCARDIRVMDMRGVKSKWRRIRDFKVTFNALICSQSSAWCWVSSIPFL